ncbi:hypothetical protein CAAN1_15S00672 [[Candida] anglica]|uniref:DOPA-dioxygenase n=1 Tax=[Candida] anglica TaxID=148631 RepID=A0ABP0E9P8_9ASCO
MEYLTHIPKENAAGATKSKYEGLSYTHPVKYYDFHIYYVHHNEESRTESDNLRQRLLDDFAIEGKEGAIIVKKLPNDKVIGPHITHFWEVDVVRPEVFIKLLSWFQLYHGNLSVLIHPNTGEPLLDHTDRALWLGPRLPVLPQVFTPGATGIPEYGVRRGKTLTPDTFDQHESSYHEDS